MDSLMEINKTPLVPLVYDKSNKFICFFQWLDTKLVITDSYDDHINRSDLYTFIISEYFNNLYFNNIDFVKHTLKIFFLHS